MFWNKLEPVHTVSSDSIISHRYTHNSLPERNLSVKILQFMGTTRSITFKCYWTEALVSWMMKAVEIQIE